MKYKARIDLGFIIAALLIFSVMSSVYVSFNQMSHQKGRVDHTYQVIYTLKDIISGLSDVQGSVRGYIITGLEDYLAPYHLAMPKVEDSLEDLNKLVADNPDQHERYVSLKEHIERRMAIAEAAIETYRLKGQDVAIESIRGGSGKREMDEIRVIVAEMTSDEKNLLEKRRVAVERSSQVTLYAGLSGVLVCLIILAAVYVLITREFNQRIRTEDSLRDAANDMERHNQETVLVSRMGDYLRGCREHEEVYNVIASSLPQLFPQSYGELGIFNHARTAIEPVMTWGYVPDDVQQAFGAADCWALRQGKGHLCTPENGAPRCGHLEDVSKDHVSFCLPMQAQGETMGLIFFGALAEEAKYVGPHEMAMMRRIAEQISLALANLNLQSALKEQSIKDPLTKLYNRRYLEETLARETARAQRNKQTMAALVMDIDFFKKVNDTYGHDGGDAVLVAFAQLLSTSVRKEDIACRLGGEEFVLVLPSANKQLAMARAEEICEAARKIHVPLQGKVIQITVSIGIAVYPEQAASADEMIQNADKALYAAKHGGRDQAVLYDIALHHLKSA